MDRQETLAVGGEEKDAHEEGREVSLWRHGGGIGAVRVEMIRPGASP